MMVFGQCGEGRRRRWSQSQPGDFRDVLTDEASVPEAEPPIRTALQRRPVRRKTNPEGGSLRVHLDLLSDDTVAPSPDASTPEDLSLASTHSTDLPMFEDFSSMGALCSSHASSARRSPCDTIEHGEEALSPARLSALHRAAFRSRNGMNLSKPSIEDEEGLPYDRNMVSSEGSSVATNFELSSSDEDDQPCNSISNLSAEEARLESLNAEIEEQEDALHNLQALLEAARSEKLVRERRLAEMRANMALAEGGGPEYWGISVKQLQDFCNEIKPDLRKYCVNHRYDPETRKHVCIKECCRHNHGCAEKRPLHLDEDPNSLPPLEPNMHTVVQLYIKPRTLDHHGILGLALTLNRKNPRKVEKFISHSWGGRFEDFVATISGNMLLETNVFICSFALPQNADVGAILSTNLQETPFARAHVSASDVLLVIDRDIEVIERVWVVYELYLSMLHNKSVRIGLNKNMGSGFRKAIMDKVDALHVRKTKATKDSDLQAIMQEIKGQEDELSEAIRFKLTEMVHNLNFLLPCQHSP
mmetsp:Transcript_120103/g.190194  ORF Transcript_120103/g.190194 Transcript_120103/m.190194 type:complete len:530 (+) Transcript_120103:29-1618(+)